MGDSKLSVFQIAVMGIFVVFAAAAIFTFAMFSGGSVTSFPPVTIWGTFDEREVNAYLNDIGRTVPELKEVTYIEKNENGFREELIEAIAEGTGPDLFLLSQHEIIQQREKIIPIPYDSYSERTFKDTFIEEGELFLSSNGTLAFPLTIDPMIMYWNRDIFTREGLAQPPKYWDETFSVAQSLSTYDEARNITQSALSLGEFGNIDHASELFSAILIQSGMPIVVLNDEDELMSVLDDTLQFSSSPTVSATRFYTEFSNPSKSTYSWNRSLASSKNAFLNGDLAVYFGFASEVTELQQRNPNLNFDVALFPQVRDSGTSATFGHMRGVAIPKGTANIEGAFFVMQALVDNESARLFSERLNLPPVRRDLLSEPQGNAYREIAYKSALMATAWLDPSRLQSAIIFKDMVESVTSGRESLNNAARIADRQLQNLIEKR